MSAYDSKGYCSHWADFYQIPVKDDIIINSFFINSLWQILHPKSYHSIWYHAAENFASTAIELIDLVCLPSYWNILVWPFTRSHITRVLCTVDTILDSEEHLGDTCYELIRDISREIDSGSVAFGASLRNRCKAASLTIEWETWRLEMIMYKQCKDFNPQRVRNAYCRISKYSGILCISVFILSLVASLFFPISPELAIRGFTLAYLMGYLAYEVPEASAHMYETVCAIRMLHSTVLKSVWAWRDIRGFLALIAESEGSQLSNVSHTKKFLDAFQASFMDGHVELWKTRSKIQTLSKFADRVQTMKEHDAHEDAAVS